MAGGDRSDPTIEDLKRRLVERAGDPGAVRRLGVAIDHAQGRSPARIAADYGLDEDDVRGWVDRIEAVGLEAALDDADAGENGPFDGPNPGGEATPDAGDGVTDTGPNPGHADSRSSAGEDPRGDRHPPGEHTRTENRLRSLHRIAQELMVATSDREIAEATLLAAEDVLDLPVSSVWRYDAERDRLVHLAHTDCAEAVVGDHPESFGPGEGLAWEVFERGTTQVFDDLHDHEDVYNPETPLRSELTIPIGEYGVFMAGSTDPDSFDEFDTGMAQVLVATAEAAFDRLERERELRESERDLQFFKELLARFLRHNLRNEINVIRGCAEDIADTGDEHAASLAEVIVESSTGLIETSEKARFVERLIDADPGPVEQPVAGVVARAAESVEVPPGVTVERDLPADLSVLAIPQLTQAVENLLDNAVEHGGSEVRVTASRDGRTVDLVVADDGPGIPPSEVEVLEHDEETPLRHGSGMGLWLVDRVVDASGGDLSFSVDGGTRAVVRLRAPPDG